MKDTSGRRTCVFSALLVPFPTPSIYTPKVVLPKFFFGPLLPERKLTGGSWGNPTNSDNAGHVEATDDAYWLSLHGFPILFPLGA